MLLILNIAKHPINQAISKKSASKLSHPTGATMPVQDVSLDIGIQLTTRLVSLDVESTKQTRNSIISSSKIQVRLVVVKAHA